MGHRRAGAGHEGALLMSIALFPKPVTGRIWDPNDYDVKVDVTIIGLERTGGGSLMAIMVDEDALLSQLPVEDVDFLSLMPDAVGS